MEADAREEEIKKRMWSNETMIAGREEREGCTGGMLKGGNPLKRTGA